MGEQEPVGELDERFSSDDATPTEWPEAMERLEKAEVYWLSTVRPDGRPHVTPIAAVWLDGSLHFTTGEGEQKALNLRHNDHVAVTTGSDVLDGIDVVVEGAVVRVADETRLRRLADAYRPKYGDLFVFAVRGGALYAEGAQDEALAYEVRPAKVFAFGKGDSYSQTRWRFREGS
jgi:pyridoxine/pyridoxamine 5'-phosphate oxidase